MKLEWILVGGAALVIAVLMLAGGSKDQDEAPAAPRSQPLGPSRAEPAPEPEPAASEPRTPPMGESAAPSGEGAEGAPTSVDEAGKAPAKDGPAGEEPTEETPGEEAEEVPAREKLPERRDAPGSLKPSEIVEVASLQWDEATWLVSLAKLGPRHRPLAWREAAAYVREKPEAVRALVDAAVRSPSEEVEDPDAPRIRIKTAKSLLRRLGGTPSQAFARVVRGEGATARRAYALLPRLPLVAPALLEPAARHAIDEDVDRALRSAALEFLDTLRDAPQGFRGALLKVVKEDTFDGRGIVGLMAGSFGSTEIVNALLDVFNKVGMNAKKAILGTLPATGVKGVRVMRTLRACLMSPMLSVGLAPTALDSLVAMAEEEGMVRRALLEYLGNPFEGPVSRERVAQALVALGDSGKNAFLDWYEAARKGPMRDVPRLAVAKEMPLEWSELKPMLTSRHERTSRLAHSAMRYQPMPLLAWPDLERWIRAGLRDGAARDVGFLADWALLGALRLRKAPPAFLEILDELAKRSDERIVELAATDLRLIRDRRVLTHWLGFVAPSSPLTPTHRADLLVGHATCPEDALPEVLKVAVMSLRDPEVRVQHAASALLAELACTRDFALACEALESFADALPVQVFAAKRNQQLQRALERVRLEGVCP